MLWWWNFFKMSTKQDCMFFFSYLLLLTSYFDSVQKSILKGLEVGPMEQRNWLHMKFLNTGQVTLFKHIMRVDYSQMRVKPSKIRRKKCQCGHSLVGVRGYKGVLLLAENIILNLLIQFKKKVFQRLELVRQSCM